jgi:hypothetical protein
MTDSIPLVPHTIPDIFPNGETLQEETTEKEGASGLHGSFRNDGINMRAKMI